MAQDKYEAIRARVRQMLADHQITLESVFVPWSMSRHHGDSEPSLNWKVKLLHKGKLVLTTDYMAGCGHCPSYDPAEMTRGWTVDQRNTVVRECETGRVEMGLNSGKARRKNGNKDTINPDPVSFLYSLLGDAEAINWSSFEDWARDMGDDPDSRRAEAAYRASVEIGLKLRNTIGEQVMGELREALQGY